MKTALALTTMALLAAIGKGEDVSVSIFDYSGLPESERSAILETAGRLLTSAGLDYALFDCGLSQCEGTRGTSEIVVRLRVKGTGGKSGTVGRVTAMGELGGLIDLARDEAEALATPETGVGMVLGHILAHEIGHILLGSERHSAAGVMKPKWGPRDAREITMKGYSFLPEEGSRMRERLRRIRDEAMQPSMKSSPGRQPDTHVPKTIGPPMARTE
jgi:hypothetical protein